jgi:hypothetical protein
MGAQAQTFASITGVVKDASGAVLPGVTVEAASPALIEKVRSVVTDGTGQYRIESLRPGVYEVTFTLPGFSTVKRVGIELQGSFSATVNAEMAVGALEETITVTGASPVVDVQNTVQQRVVDKEIMDTLPGAREAMNVAGITIPGVTSSERDVGGVSLGRGPALMNIVVHGGVGNDQQIFLNGVDANNAARFARGFAASMNAAGIRETTMDTSAGSAEASTGGARVNTIPQDGGNVFSGTTFTKFTTGPLQSNNLSDDLIARGLRHPDSIKTHWEINPGVGGPIKRDRLWFFVSARYFEDASYVAGMYDNKNAGNPNAWTYEPDLSRRAYERSTFPEGQIRFSWQAAPKHKLGLTWNEQSISYNPQGTSPTVAPEAGNKLLQPGVRVFQMEDQSPLTARILVEAGYLYNHTNSDQLPYDDYNPVMISVLEQSTGLRYRSPEFFRVTPEHTNNWKVSLSYITGAHAVKVGVTHKSGQHNFNSFDFQPLSYRFNNGVPNQLTQRAFPVNYTGNIDHNLGVFAQDKWTVQRLTLSYGVRYDYFANSFPEVTIGPAALAPNRNFTFPHQDNIFWKDITPKVGVAYDLFGTGKTAFKASANKYLQNAGAGFGGDTGILGGGHPSNSLITTTTRSWNDANRNFVPNCDLINTAANGECGAMANANFGKQVPGRTYDPGIMQGWGVRGYNWEFSAGLQHELLPRVAVDVGYFRRVYGNITVTDDLAVSPADYDPFQITAPVDPRLPGGGGYVISDLYDLKPSKFGVPAAVLYTNTNRYGKQLNHWNGVDVTFNAQLAGGVLVRGGTSTGRTSTDNCDVIAKLDNPSRRFCHSNFPFRTEVKFSGSYTIPRVDVLLAAVFQSIPDSAGLAANYNAPNAVVAPSLGRNLSGNAANVTVNLVEPGTIFRERKNQVDLRFAKIVRFGAVRSTLSIDVFNALNADTILGENTNFAAWRRPTEILLARFVRLSAQIDF